MKRFLQILFLILGSGIGNAQLQGNQPMQMTNVNVTFMVDMSEQVVSPLGVHVAGSFNSWNPAATVMTQAGAGTVYEVTLALVAGETVQFKYINGNA
jgi:hypothetical protein